MMDSYNAVENIIKNLHNNINKGKSNSLYLYGKSGIGKTTMVKNILSSNHIDYLYYDINCLKDRNHFNDVFYSANGNVNILNCFHGQNDKHIVYIIDNIDHIQNNEKVFLGNIIKAIRPRKKTKKEIETGAKKNKKGKGVQNLDNIVVFIGTNVYEKKIKELLKIASSYELKKHEKTHFNKLIDGIVNIEPSRRLDFYNFCNNDYQKINLIQRIIQKCENQQHNMQKDLKYQSVMEHLLQQRQLSNYNENIIYCVNKLLFFPKKMKNDIYIHDNDKTIVSLLFHENVIDYLSSARDYSFYKNFLKNICDGDYLDRVCFQKQIWILNEMTYYLKVDKNYEEYNKLKQANSYIKYLQKHNIKYDKMKNNDKNYALKEQKSLYEECMQQEEKCFDRDILLKTQSRFTKVLTKYSTEYNNNNFIICLCKKLNMDRKSLFNTFYTHYEDEEFYSKLDAYDISKLDIRRMNTLIFNDKTN